MADSLYKSLTVAYIKAHPTKKKQTCQADVNLIWNDIKKGHSSDLTMAVQRKLEELKRITLSKQSKLLSIWATVSYYLF